MLSRLESRASHFKLGSDLKDKDNAANLFLLLFVVGVLIYISVQTLRRPEKQHGTAAFQAKMLDQTSPGMDPLRGTSTRTYEETVHETGGMTTAPPSPAGGPGNTIAPVVAPNTPPDTHYSMTDFDWGQIHHGTKIVWVGCKLKGPYQQFKDKGYFVLLQTPPPSNAEIYGDFSLFVEGGKIGIRLAGNSVITMQGFDYDHKNVYLIEAKVTILSLTRARVDLIIDGANSGHSFTIYNENIVDRLRELPGRMEMLPNVMAAWLQQNKEFQNNWGSIVEKVVNQ
jgi:hypothetical protein